ncbi:replication factor C subunit 4-like [Clavelina lepadiformis]
MTSLVTCSEGDLRKSVTYLQTAYSLKGEEGITRDDVLEIIGVIPEDVLKQFIQGCASNSYDKIQAVVNDIIAEGHAASRIIQQVFDEIVIIPSLGDDQKCVVAEKIAVIDKCLNDGANEYLQLMALATTLQQQMASS